MIYIILKGNKSLLFLLLASLLLFQAKDAQIPYPLAEKNDIHTIRI